MLRDGVLSPNSKVLQQQEEDLLGSHGRGSVMSFTSGELGLFMKGSCAK